MDHNRNKHKLDDEQKKVDTIGASAAAPQNSIGEAVEPKLAVLRPEGTVETSNENKDAGTSQAKVHRAEKCPGADNVNAIKPTRQTTQPKPVPTVAQDGASNPSSTITPQQSAADTMMACNFNLPILHRFDSPTLAAARAHLFLNSATRQHGAHLEAFYENMKQKQSAAARTHPVAQTQKPNRSQINKVQTQEPARKKARKMQTRSGSALQQKSVKTTHEQPAAKKAKHDAATHNSPAVAQPQLATRSETEAADLETKLKFMAGRGMKEAVIAAKYNVIPEPNPAEMEKRLELRANKLIEKGLLFLKDREYFPENHPPMKQLTWVERILKYDVRTKTEDLESLKKAAQKMSKLQRKIIGITFLGTRRAASSSRKFPRSGEVLHPQLKQVWSRYEEVSEKRIKIQERIDNLRKELDEAEAELKGTDSIYHQLEEEVQEEEIKMDNDFTRMYRQMLRFKEEHGRLPFPATGTNKKRKIKEPMITLDKSADFINFCKQQRHHYGNLMKGRFLTLYPNPTKFHVKALKEAGFVFDIPKHLWPERFEKLKAFKSKNGHTSVPKNYPPDMPFAAWVHRQRYFYKLFHEGKPNQLTQERIDMLNSIGFLWSGNAYATTPEESRLPKKTIPRKGVETTGEEAFEIGFNALLAVKAEVGHFLRISHQRPYVRDFVAFQRRQYRLFKAGKPSNTTEDRIRRLEEIGLPWEASGRATKAAKNLIKEAESTKEKAEPPVDRHDREQANSVNDSEEIYDLPNN